MTAKPGLELTPQERAFVYLGERIRMLRKEIEIAQNEVQEGRGDVIVPFIDVPFCVHLDQLRGALADAEADLDLFSKSRGPLQ